MSATAHLCQDGRFRRTRSLAWICGQTVCDLQSGHLSARVKGDCSTSIAIAQASEKLKSCAGALREVKIHEGAEPDDRAGMTWSA